MKTIFIISLFLLSGCVEEEAPVCPENYIYDYEYITLEDGSVITGKPIYKCNWNGTAI